jgi:hypothetical protein
VRAGSVAGPAQPARQWQHRHPQYLRTIALGRYFRRGSRSVAEADKPCRSGIGRSRDGVASIAKLKAGAVDGRQGASAGRVALPAEYPPSLPGRALCFRCVFAACDGRRDRYTASGWRTGVLWDVMDVMIISTTYLCSVDIKTSYPPTAREPIEQLDAWNGAGCGKVIFARTRSSAVWSVHPVPLLSATSSLVHRALNPARTLARCDVPELR